ncbi:unnamed protein product [Rotaria sp. Silwood1]|nr:unnamed protein product [Rotaria sp. Silwood1]
MSISDVLHKILNLRKQYLTNLNDDDDNNELSNLFNQLLKWQQEIINKINKYVQKKLDEIKEKYFEINRQQIHYLDILYANCLSNCINHNNQEHNLQLLEHLNNIHSSIQIIHPKQIDFNQYCELKINHLNDIHNSILLMNNKNSFNLSSYQLFSTLPIQSNITSLFAVHDQLLVYYDHYTSSSSYLHIFDLQTYLEQTNNKHLCLKLRIPCKQFREKIIHIEYCSYLQRFLIATSSKLFTLQISKTDKNHCITEYYDIHHENFSGILQKFTFHPISSNLIYFLINKFSQYILIEIDLSENFNVIKQWNYPKIDNTKIDLLKNIDNNINNLNNQLKTINDFIVGKNIFLFIVTYESNNISSNQFYEFHIRSFDMNLQHRLLLNTLYCPLHIFLIPYDYSSISNQQEQCIIIFQKSKILSLYNINNNKLELINEIILDIEPEYLGFATNDLSILLIRNLFHIAIYKRINNNTIDMN